MKFLRLDPATVHGNPIPVLLLAPDVTESLASIITTLLTDLIQIDPTTQGTTGALQVIQGNVAGPVPTTTFQTPQMSAVHTPLQGNGDFPPLLKMPTASFTKAKPISDLEEAYISTSKEILHRSFGARTSSQLSGAREDPVKPSAKSKLFLQRLLIWRSLKPVLT